MIKMFCDQCGNEIKINRATDRLAGVHKKVRVEVIAGTHGVSNGGQICTQCTVEAVRYVAAHGRLK